VDQSANLGRAADGGQDVLAAHFDGQPWRLQERHLRAVQAASVRPPRHEALTLTAGLSLQPVYATLGRLGFVLTGVSLGLWLTAALLGRGLCRRALAPVTRMAEATRTLSAADLERRLPVPASGDELTALGLAFNDLLGRLHEAFERQRRFTADASHQLRTPLTALLGQIEVACRRERPAEEYRGVLERVHGQAARLRQLVEMLLFLARADAEARLPDLVPLDLAGWLPEYLQGWSVHDRAADLHLDCPPNPPPVVRVQAALLGQLLDNLLDNACKYSPPGTEVTVGVRCDADAVAVTVTDAGCGIAAADLPHVFEPFYRSAQVRGGPGGVGLGLAVARRIAAAFGGSLTVASTAGKGCRFTLRLPGVPSAAACPGPGEPLYQQQRPADAMKEQE
jgi:signal transduction histidine kinase